MSDLSKIFRHSIHSMSSMYSYKDTKAKVLNWLSEIDPVPHTTTDLPEDRGIEETSTVGSAKHISSFTTIDNSSLSASDSFDSLAEMSGNSSQSSKKKKEATEMWVDILKKECAAKVAKLNAHEGIVPTKRMFFSFMMKFEEAVNKLYKFPFTPRTCTLSIIEGNEQLTKKEFEDFTKVLYKKAIIEATLQAAPGMSETSLFLETVQVIINKLQDDIKANIDTATAVTNISSVTTGAGGSNAGSNAGGSNAGSNSGRIG